MRGRAAEIQLLFMSVLFIDFETSPYRTPYAIGFGAVVSQNSEDYPQILVFIGQPAQITYVTVGQHRFLIIDFQYRPVIAILDKRAELAANTVIKASHIGIVGQVVDMLLECVYIIETPVYLILQISPYAMAGMKQGL